MSSSSGLSLIYGGGGQPGRPLSREEALAGQRGRLMAAIAASVARKGYAATTISDVVSGAATSRRTFYEHFRDKEDCYLASYDRAVDYLLGNMAAASPASSDWLTLVRASVHTYLGILAVEPEFGAAFLIEVAAAGPAALQRRDEVHDQFAAFIQAIHTQARTHQPGLAELPARVFTGLVGAINDLVGRTIRGRGCQALPELEDDVLLLIAATFRGAANASNLLRTDGRQASTAT